MILKKEFYEQPALTVAAQILGCRLCRKLGGKTIKAMIVETEAYDGPDDQASHASRGQTPRNSPMFGDAGIFYVYLTYGMHHMLNVVVGPAGYPAAVLIRAAEPVGNFWKNDAADLRNKIALSTNGPARLTKALEIDRSFNNLPAYSKKNGLWIEAGASLPSQEIVRANRVGIDYAGEYKNKLWRFYIKNSRFVSKK